MEPVTKVVHTLQPQKIEAYKKCSKIKYGKKNPEEGDQNKESVLMKLT